MPRPHAARSRPRAALLALAVGVVLADSAIVTLALPDILGDLDATTRQVAWVLVSYNAALALTAVPAAVVIRHASPAAVIGVGLVAFAAASLACALAPSLGFLVAARAVQGLGGAAVACAALVLLEAAAGGRARGTAVWGAAAALGAAIGPAAGGVLTEALSWESIFFVQVPVALVALAALRSPTERVVEPRVTRPDVRHLMALAFVSAGLTAALFLLVLMLVAGWRLSPITAALTVSVIPVAAVAAGRLRVGGRTTRSAAGAVLLTGGLAALGLLPGASVGWTIAPQVFVGIGLGLSLGTLTEAALDGRRPLATHGGWTLTARHIGVVLALAVLTPLFSSDLERQGDRATEAVIAGLLDSGLHPAIKLDLAARLAAARDTATNEVPDVDLAFAALTPSREESAGVAALRERVTDELDRGATSAFKRSFLVAAALSLLALVPLLSPARRRGR